MRLPLAIRRLMADSITVRLASGPDAYNSFTLGDPQVVRGRVTYARTSSRTASGEQRIESTVVILPDIAGLDIHAVLTLPDGTQGSPQSVRRLTWPGGNTYHLQVVM